MAQREQLEAGSFSPDITDFLRLLVAHEVQYLIVGGEAVIYYGYARLTGDVDFFYARNPANAERLHAALLEFWNGIVPDLSSADELLEEGLILQFGVPPNRIDLINRISGVSFEEAWNERTSAALPDNGGTIPIHYIGPRALMKNKEASGRAKDLVDLEYLRDREQG